jgi:hypothetical protein
MRCACQAERKRLCEQPRRPLLATTKGVRRLLRSEEDHRASTRSSLHARFVDLNGAATVASPSGLFGGNTQNRRNTGTMARAPRVSWFRYSGGSVAAKGFVGVPLCDRPQASVIVADPELRVGNRTRCSLIGTVARADAVSALVAFSLPTIRTLLGAESTGRRSSYTQAFRSGCPCESRRFR